MLGFCAKLAPHPIMLLGPPLEKTGKNRNSGRIECQQASVSAAPKSCDVTVQLGGDPAVALASESRVLACTSQRHPKRGLNRPKAHEQKTIQKWPLQRWYHDFEILHGSLLVLGLMTLKPSYCIQNTSSRLSQSWAPSEDEARKATTRALAAGGESRSRK